jgi:8-oxo-dGTP pyrophosphatase MutT (NUDIX family)
MSKPYLTTREAAAALGFTTNSLLRWANQGLVTPVSRSPGRGDMRWDLDDLRRQLGARPQLHEPAPTAHDPKAPVKPPVAAAIVTSKHGVLVERRHDGRPLWTFPAGEIEPGESPEDAAIRETKEETGLQVVISHTIGERDHPKTGTHMYYLAARAFHGTDVHNGDEAELAEVKWVDLAEAEELLVGMFEPVHEHLARVLRKRRTA